MESSLLPLKSSVPYAICHVWKGGCYVQSLRTIWTFLCYTSFRHKLGTHRPFLYSNKQWHHGQKYSKCMKMSTPTSLWCYCSYALKWNVGKVYWLRVMVCVLDKSLDVVPKRSPDKSRRGYKERSSGDPDEVQKMGPDGVAVGVWMKFQRGV